MEEESKEYSKDYSVKQNRKYGLWDLLRDFLGMSLAYGQFITAVTGLVIVVGMFRVTPQELGTITFEVIDFFGREYWGYSIAVFTLVGWSWHVRLLRDLYKRQTDQLESQRLAWQKFARELAFSSATKRQTK